MLNAKTGRFCIQHFAFCTDHDVALQAIASPHLRPCRDVRSAYTARERLLFAAAAVVVAVLIAGFWNPRVADGFGRDVIAGRTLGDPDALSGTFDLHGLGFGFIFAAIAGLAATFTACNCVVFAMIPGLAAGDGSGSRAQALKALGVFASAVTAVSLVYGTFIGFLGPHGIVAYNSREMRLAQANGIFSAIGVVMLIWGAVELGFFDRIVRRTSPITRAFFEQPTTKAAVLGVLVGLFSVGRPFPVMRDFLVYAASANSPLYGAAVMVLQGLGQIAVMAAVYLLLVYVFRTRLAEWAGTRPHQAALASGLALIAGGTFFLFYWGFAFALGIGRWGFRLGWYS